MCAKKIQPTKDSAPNPFVSTPLRREQRLQTFRYIYSIISKRLPRLSKEIEMSNMNIAPQEFVKKCLIMSFSSTIIIELILLWAFVTQKVDILTTIGVILITLPILFLFSFNSSIYEPRVRIIKRGKEIDKEIVFAGRHLLIELRSGVTLFDAMLGISNEYGEVSREFSKIVEKITLGVPTSVALHEVAEKSPSTYFKRIVLQIANSIASGSDVADSLEAVLEQVAKEQMIQLKAYGQKLNPLVMFYMLFGIVIPSLGVAFMIIVFSVVGVGFESMGLTFMAGMLGVIILLQYLFLSVAQSSRPNFDL